MAKFQFSVGDAINAGYSMDQINQFLAQQKAQGNNYTISFGNSQPQSNQLPATPTQTQPKNQWADFLPTAGAIAAPLIADVFTGGTALPADMAISGGGAAAGSFLKNLIEGQPLNVGDAATQGVLGAAGTGIGGVASKVVGGALGKLGEGEAINGLNLTRLQQNALKIKNGEPVAQTLTNHNLVGVNTEGLTEGIGKVQNIFDSIAKNNNVPIDQNAFLKNATTALTALKNSSVPSDQALAPQVEEALGNVIDKIANGKVTTLADLNAERQAFDNATKDSQFGSSPWGVNRTVGDILRSTAYDSADASNATGPNGESLKTVGQNLRKLYNIQSVADKRVGQGNSAGILSVSNMLLGGLGALAGSPAGPAGSLAGYAATQVARKALTNPTVAGALSKTLTNTSKGLATPIAQNATQALGAGALTLPITPQGTSDNSNNQNNSQNPDQSNTLPSSPQATFAGNNSTINGLGSQALPPTPTSTGTSTQQQALTDTLGGSAAAPDSFMAGYTMNGAPVDPALKNMLWQIVNYRIDPTKATSLKNNERQQLIEMASQVDPSYDQSTFASKNAIMKSYQGGGKGAQTVNALNTAINHLYLLSQNAKALGNTNLIPFNALKNSFETNTGSDKYTNFNQTANAVSSEMANVMKASGATDSEISAFKQGFNANMSPAQIQGTIAQMIGLMAGRLNALQGQYENGMGRPSDYSFITPESQAILQGLQGNTNPNQLAPSPQQQTFAP